MPSGSAVLVVKRGPNAGSRFLLDQPVTSAGRHPNSDIFLDDVTVSRRHAEFRRENDEFRIFGSGWAPARATRTPAGPREAADDLNHNIFALSRPVSLRRILVGVEVVRPRCAPGAPPPPPQRSTEARQWPGNQAKHRKQATDPPLPGVPNTDKARLVSRSDPVSRPPRWTPGLLSNLFCLAPALLCCDRGYGAGDLAVDGSGGGDADAGAVVHHRRPGG